MARYVLSRRESRLRSSVWVVLVPVGVLVGVGCFDGVIPRYAE